MPIVPLKNTTYYIHVLHLDKYGAELPEVDGSLLSDTLVDRLQVDPPVSDVMICSHGFNVVPTRASKSYTEWLSAMAAHREGVEKMKAARGDPFVPLLIGIHWPSCVGGTLRAKRDTAPDGLTATDVGKGLLKGLFRTTVAVAEGVASGALEARDQFGQGMSLWDQAVAVGGATTKPLANEVFGRFEERAQMVGRRASVSCCGGCRPRRCGRKRRRRGRTPAPSPGTTRWVTRWAAMWFVPPLPAPRAAAATCGGRCTLSSSSRARCRVLPFRRPAATQACTAAWRA